MSFYPAVCSIYFVVVAANLVHPRFGDRIRAYLQNTSIILTSLVMAVLRRKRQNKKEQQREKLLKEFNKNSSVPSIVLALLF